VSTAGPHTRLFGPVVWLLGVLSAVMLVLSLVLLALGDTGSAALGLACAALAALGTLEFRRHWRKVDQSARPLANAEPPAPRAPK